ncbi:MAG: N-acetyltransferase [Nitrospinae bacterium]|nr:N-acetyltransferase [Nitrospinota bacterium]
MEVNITPTAQKEAPALPGIFRPAVIADARKIQSLINGYAEKGLMLPRSLNDLFEAIRQYIIYEENGEVVGVCGLHVAWEDLAEVRGLAVDQAHSGKGIGAQLVTRAIAEAKKLGIPKVFCLTYVPGFFSKLGFTVVEKHEFPHKIWSDCVRCHKFPDCDETGMARLVDL